ncbi:MAG: hypothetical protein IPP77_06470 [Bacteroidetes bacterium]|nr:hypothetical protein [Bacteroidota bacterium]
MIATDFNEKYFMYENMAIWEINSMEDFFKSHNMMKEIFKNEYGVPYSEETSKGINLMDAGFAIVEKLLDCFRDKHFVVFSMNDENHNILKGLQDKKVINFGMDIHVLNPRNIYVLEMDKTKDLQKYDS